MSINDEHMENAQLRSQNATPLPFWFNRQPLVLPLCFVQRDTAYEILAQILTALLINRIRNNCRRSIQVYDQRHWKLCFSFLPKKFQFSLMVIVFLEFVNSLVRMATRSVSLFSRVRWQRKEKHIRSSDLCTLKDNLALVQRQCFAVWGFDWWEKTNIHYF